MIEITQEQRDAMVAVEEPVFFDPLTKQSYVLVPQEIFDRIKGLLYDNGEWTADERLQLLAESGVRAGWNAPEMDAYDNYDENRGKLCP